MNTWSTEPDRKGNTSWGVLAVAALVWIMLLPRMIPSTLAADHGTFVTVAERILGGQALYLEVWDRKDPLFFFTLALGRIAGPWADFALEAVWILLASLALYLLAGWAGLDRPQKVIAGFVVAPLVVTGSFYVAGYTHVPALSLTLLALAAAARRQELLSGVLVSVTLFMNIRVAPIAIVLILVVIVMQRRTRTIIAVLVGFGATSASVLLLLLLRGELIPYLDMLRQNVEYADSPLLLAGRPSIIGHLERTLTPTSLALILLVLGLLLYILSLSGVKTILLRRSPEDILWLVVAAALVSAFGVIAVTGLFFHHNQVLYVPVALGCVLLMRGLNYRSLQRSWILALSWTCIGLALAGVGWRDYLNAALNPRGALVGLSTLAPEAQALLTLGPTGTYARVGRVAEGGHGYGTRGWRLECPRFEQNPFDAPELIAQAWECTSKADTILVGLEVTTEPYNPVWNRYISSVRELLARDFKCDAVGDIQICTRTTSA